MKMFVKDPAAVLDYVWDWSDWLGDDTIESFEITVPEPLVLDDSGEVDGEVTAWLSGGLEGKSYTVVCQIITVDGRTDERSAVFNMVNR